MNGLTPNDGVSVAGRLSEDEFLDQISREDLALDDILSSLEALAAVGAIAQAEARARWLQELLAERRRPLDALTVLAKRVAWAGDGRFPPETLSRELLEIVGPGSDGRALLEATGLEADRPTDTIERLRTLMCLAPGVICLDRTWGVGVVRHLDFFDRKVEIDFERRTGHRMSFAYASETLKVLPPDHLLVQWQRDPVSVRTRAKTHPADVVFHALHSFGPMTLAQLQEILCPRIVEAEAWKEFWETARRELRRRGHVRIPTRRSEPLTLCAAEASTPDDSATALLADRDPHSILERVQRALSEGKLSEAMRASVLNRLDFVRRASARTNRTHLVRATLLAATAGFTEEEFPFTALLESWAQPDELLETLHAAGSRDLPRFLRWLADRLGENFDRHLLELLPRWRATALADVMEFLLERRQETAIATAVREMVARKQISVELLLWLHRNWDRWLAWQLGSWADYARLALAALEVDLRGERLKAQNALRERLEKPEWLRSLMDNAGDDATREDLFDRFRRTPAWTPLDRRAVLAHLVRARPELEARLREEPVGSETAPLTSIRSYRDRQEQLRRLIEVDIPKNSREIALARSYGDLRENFEYKAAKDMQALLMRRQAELEAALKRVQPTDFAHTSTERVAPGVGVDIEFEGGRRERFYVLGVWDGDATRRVLSSESRMAQALMGRAPGDRVRVPSEDGEVSATLLAILPLPDELRAWIRGEE